MQILIVASIILFVVWVCPNVQMMLIHLFFGSTRARTKVSKSDNSTFNFTAEDN